MPICLPQQCLALVNGLPPPGDPLFRESPGWWVRRRSVGHKHRTCSHVFVPKTLKILGNCFMPICLPQQCLTLVNGLPPPGNPLFRESPGLWVRLRSVGHKHRTCSHVFVPENLENFEELFYAYMSTPAMPGPCESIFFSRQQMKKTVNFQVPGKNYTKVPQKKFTKGHSL